VRVSLCLYEVLLLMIKNDQGYEMNFGQCFDDYMEAKIYLEHHVKAWERKREKRTATPC